MARTHLLFLIHKLVPHQMLMDQIERTQYLGYLCIFLWLTVNPNIKLVREYNYSGGSWLALSSLFSAYRSPETKLAILLPQKVSPR